jgi:hypothetical protein
VFIEALTKGARGLNDLTNYVYFITNNRVFFNNGTPSVQPLGYDSTFLTTGARIVGLMSTPQYTDVPGNPIGSLVGGNGVSNHIIAYVRSISGAASEKPPQDNPIIRGGKDDSGDSFAYHVLCVNAPVAMDTNLYNATLYPDGPPAYDKQLAANLRELRLTFFWPIQPNGKVGTGRQSYRTLVTGQMQSDKSINTAYLYYFQPQAFTNAP